MKRVLVAVDGSEQALQAVRYVGTALPPGGVEIVLFHVMTKIPDSFWDLKQEPAFHYRVASIQAWEQQQEKLIETFMSRAREILRGAGVPDAAVSVNIRERQVGIARDILAESQNGYDAVVVGRKGLSELKDLILGNVANKILERITNVPVWVVGGAAGCGRLLLSIDASEGAMQAVDYVATTLGGHPNLHVRLFHVIRGFDVFQQVMGQTFVPGHGTDWVELAAQELEEAAREMEPVFEAARNRLVAAGMEPSRIDQKLARGVSSRAGAVVEEAERESFDTIVVGRRGMSRVQEFFMGRVSNKVIQLAREKTVWVIS